MNFKSGTLTFRKQDISNINGFEKNAKSIKYID